MLLAHTASAPYITPRFVERRRSTPCLNLTTCLHLARITLECFTGVQPCNLCRKNQGKIGQWLSHESAGQESLNLFSPPQFETGLKDWGKKLRGGDSNCSASLAVGPDRRDLRSPFGIFGSFRSFGSFGSFDLSDLSDHSDLSEVQNPFSTFHTESDRDVRVAPC